MRGPLPTDWQREGTADGLLKKALVRDTLCTCPSFFLVYEYYNPDTQTRRETNKHRKGTQAATRRERARTLRHAQVQTHAGGTTKEEVRHGTRSGLRHEVCAARIGTCPRRDAQGVPDLPCHGAVKGNRDLLLRKAEP